MARSAVQGMFGNRFFGKYYDVLLSLILVIIERESPSVPFRTRQGNPVSPMVLWLKPRKSRSSPELSPVDPSVCYTAAADVKTEIYRPCGGFFICFWRVL